MNELEQIRKLDLKIDNLEREKKILEHQLEQSHDRRKRTHLLIQTGALAEKYLPIKNMTFEERETYFKSFNNRKE